MKQNIMLCISLLYFTSCNIEFKKLYCDREKTKVVLVPKKNQLKYLNDKRETNIKIIVDSVMGYTGRIQLDATRKREITQIVDSLNQTNVYYNQIINAYYVGLLADYCNPEIVKRYFESVDSLRADVDRLERLRQEVSKIITSSGIGGTDVSDLIISIKSYLNTRK